MEIHSEAAIADNERSDFPSHDLTRSDRYTS